MIYPKWLKENDIIGITAPSAGAGEKRSEEMALAYQHFKAAGFKVEETKSVRSDTEPSAPAQVRAAEWKAMAERDDIALILLACGGDFLYEMLPYTELESLKAYPKWVQGFSDPTGLLFGITTKLDIATIYGGNCTSFGMKKLHPSLQENIRLWKGELNAQESFALYEAQRLDGTDGYNLTTPVNWKTPNGAVDVSGRLIGGCMESLLDLIGTPYEAACDFVTRYQADGCIWYFDIFALSAESVYRGLLHMKAAGWFKGAKGFIFGRVLFPSTDVYMTYEDAVVGALGKDMPIVMEADVGHVNPRMTFVNGCMAHIKSNDGKGKVAYKFV